MWIKLSIVFLIVILTSCSENRNIDAVLIEDVLVNDVLIEQDSVIVYDSLFHNCLESSLISSVLLKPGFSAIENIEDVLGWCEKSTGITCMTNGTCFPVTAIYIDLGLKFHYQKCYDNFVSSIVLLNSETVKLKTGIQIDKSSREDVLSIYGNNFEENLDRYETVMNYHHLGISFVLKKDTVNSFKIYEPFTSVKYEDDKEEYRNSLNSPVYKEFKVSLD